MLRPSQFSTLKTFLETDPTFAPLVASRHLGRIVRLLNQKDNTFIAWNDEVTISEFITAASFDPTAIGPLTAAQYRMWETFTNLGIIDMGRQNMRQLITAIFGSGSVNELSMLATGKRTATVAEKVFASGTGTDASPARLTFTGDLSINEIEQALRG